MSGTMLIDKVTERALKMNVKDSVFHLDGHHKVKTQYGIRSLKC